MSPQILLRDSAALTRALRSDPELTFSQFCEALCAVAVFLEPSPLVPLSKRCASRASCLLWPD